VSRRRAPGGVERGPVEDQQVAHAAGLIVLTLDGERISAVTRFLDSGVLDRFGLHQTLPGDAELGAPA
jgi:hypothetical protein